jgi:hypothetical protein
LEILFQTWIGIFPPGKLESIGTKGSKTFYSYANPSTTVCQSFDSVTLYEGVSGKFKKYFLCKLQKTLALSAQNAAILCQSLIITLLIEMFSTKIGNIAKNSDHNVDPGFVAIIQKFASH